MNIDNLRWTQCEDVGDRYYVFIGHDTGNVIKAVRLCDGDRDYVTRKFEDSRLAQTFIDLARKLKKQLDCGEIEFEQAKADF